MKYSELSDLLKSRIEGTVTEHKDGSISVDGRVLWHTKNLTKIPIKFRHVTGNFACDYNNLTSLENAPDLVGGDATCSKNKLVSLDGLGEVRGKVVCFGNPIPERQLLSNYRQKRAKKELAEESLAIERILA